MFSVYRAAGWFKVETGSITKCLLMPAYHHVNTMVSILPLQELKGIVIIFMESLMLLLAITRHIIDTGKGISTLTDVSSFNY